MELTNGMNREFTRNAVKFRLLTTDASSIEMFSTLATIGQDIEYMNDDRFQVVVKNGAAFVSFSPAKGIHFLLGSVPAYGNFKSTTKKILKDKVMGKTTILKMMMWLGLKKDDVVAFEGGLMQDQEPMIALKNDKGEVHYMFVSHTYYSKFNLPTVGSKERNLGGMVFFFSELEPTTADFGIDAISPLHQGMFKKPIETANLPGL